MSEGRHVAIIGAGAVGVISAIEALREGHRVTLIDPGTPGDVLPLLRLLGRHCNHFP